MVSVVPSPKVIHARKIINVGKVGELDVWIFRKDGFVWLGKEIGDDDRCDKQLQLDDTVAVKDVGFSSVKRGDSRHRGFRF